MFSVRLALVLLIAPLCAAAPHRYPAAGLVLTLDPPHQAVTISHQSIPGFMDAMAMPFHVRTPQLLDRLHPGDAVTFTLVVDRTHSWIEEVRPIRYDSPERDPSLASRLSILDAITAPQEPKPLAIGESATFTLIDQNASPALLSNFLGKVVVLDFIYTRCPLPDYCFRLSTNFARLQKRFAATADLALLTITFDPIHDGPAELSRYARIWKADPRLWHFLTGPLPEIQRVCSLFGVAYWPDEGVFTHTLRTAILDRQGKLVANLEGNQFTAMQLGDLVQTILAKR